MKIGFIWCEDSLKGIGKDNDIPWRVKSEQEHFKIVTEETIVIMGRKTYESMGGSLPNRVNVILTTNKDYVVEDRSLVYNSVEEFMSDREKGVFSDKKVWVIGGKEIFVQFLQYAEVLFISRLKRAYDCDTYMDINIDEFKLVQTKPRLNYTLFIYIRKTLQLSAESIKKTVHLF